jgi:hypothetical protein
MSQPAVIDSWSDEVDESSTCQNRPTNENGVNVNEPRAEGKTAYAIRWGEKIEVSAPSCTACCAALTGSFTLQITDDLIAQICPADLANHVCEFDYVMPNGCDHNCEMLRLCEVSSRWLSGNLDKWTNCL